jgi:hypothetical protein
VRGDREAEREKERGAQATGRGDGGAGRARPLSSPHAAFDLIPPRPPPPLFFFQPRLRHRLLQRGRPSHRRPPGADPHPGPAQARHDGRLLAPHVGPPPAVAGVGARPPGRRDGHSPSVNKQTYARRDEGGRPVRAPPSNHKREAHVSHTHPSTHPVFFYNTRTHGRAGELPRPPDAAGVPPPGRGGDGGREARLLCPSSDTRAHTKHTRLHSLARRRHRPALSLSPPPRPLRPTAPVPPQKRDGAAHARQGKGKGEAHLNPNLPPAHPPPRLLSFLISWPAPPPTPWPSWPARPGGR